MRVLIAGTGGVGGYFGARLQQAGNDVWFLARGDNLARAARTTASGCAATSATRDLSPVRAVADAAEVGGPVDAVLFCVKAYDDDAMADAIAPASARDVDHVAPERRREPRRSLRSGSPRRSSWAAWPASRAGRKRRASSTSAARTTSWSSARSGRRTGPAVEALGAAFAGTPVVFEAADDIESQLWFKLMGICCVGGITAYCRCPIGVGRADPVLRPLMESIAGEVAAVAAARGIVFPVPDPVPTVLRYIDEVLRPELKASMCRDVEAGRPLEVGWLNGAVVRFGERAGVPTPANRRILDALLPLHREALREKT